MRELIENYIKKNEHFNISYESSEFINVDSATDEIKQHIDYLKTKLNFSYGDNLCVDQPFAPMIVWRDGHRSPSIEDLTEADIPKLNELLAFTQDHFLLGKINDILGVLTHNEIYVENAAEHLYMHFKNAFKVHPNHVVAEILKRPLYLWYSIKSYGKIDTIVKELVDDKMFPNIEDRVVILYVLSQFVSKYIKKYLSLIVESIVDCLAKEPEASDVILELINTVILYFSSKHDKANCNIWRIKYKDVCCALAEHRGNHGYKYYEKAIEHLDSNDHEDIINDLRFKIDETQESLFDSLNMKSMPIDLPQNIEKKFFDQRESVIKTLNSASDGATQLAFLIAQIKPKDIYVIEKEIESQKHSLLRFVNNVSFNDEKHVAFESSGASEEDQLEFDIAKSLQVHLWIQYELILAPFVYFLKTDDTICSLLDEILDHNYFVPSERKKIIKDAFVLGFNKGIREALLKLLSQFEFGCKNYCKVYKRIHTTTKAGSMQVPVDLNKMLVQKHGKPNKYRAAIQEILGDNLTLTLEYLSCRPLSGNIRNRNYHDGIKDPNNYDLEELSLFYYLFEAYCLGYDPEIN